MKNIAIPILVAVIFLILATYLVAFQVRESELAFVTRFGEPVRSITRPGLKLKWPTPIERVHQDERLLVLLNAAERPIDLPIELGAPLAGVPVAGSPLPGLSGPEAPDRVGADGRLVVHLGARSGTSVRFG